MKKIALGLVTAAAVFTAVPAMAQIGFYAGPGGVGVGVGAPGPYYDCGYYGRGRRSPQLLRRSDCEILGVGPRWHHYRHWDHR